MKMKMFIIIAGVAHGLLSTEMTKHNKLPDLAPVWPGICSRWVPRSWPLAAVQCFNEFLISSN